MPASSSATTCKAQPVADLVSLHTVQWLTFVGGVTAAASSSSGDLFTLSRWRAVWSVCIWRMALRSSSFSWARHFIRSRRFS